MPNNINVATGIAGGVIGPLLWYAVRGEKRKKDMPRWQQLLEILGSAAAGAGAGYYTPSMIDWASGAIRSITSDAGRSDSRGGGKSTPTTKSVQTEEKSPDSIDRAVDALNTLSLIGSVAASGKARLGSMLAYFATTTAPEQIAAGGRWLKSKIGL